MTSYRDMTFCPYYEECLTGSTCPSALTDSVKKDAERWWQHKTNLLISVFSGKPECFVSKDDFDIRR